MSRFHAGARSVLAAVMVLLAGCGDLPGFNKQAAKPEQTPPTVDKPPGDLPTVRLQGIETALRQRNLGVARDLATAAQAEFPDDSRIHLARARIEAELGNAGDSAAAFLLALDHGLVDPAAALAQPVFGKVRDGAPFAEVRRRLAALGPVAAGRPRAAASPSSRLSAGDVEIVESGDGARIRAGDVVLEADD